MNKAEEITLRHYGPNETPTRQAQQLEDAINEALEWAAQQADGRSPLSEIAFDIRQGKSKP
jgi:hypothetical protein